jgi:hypothetical protein
MIEKPRYGGAFCYFFPPSTTVNFRRRSAGFQSAAQGQRQAPRPRAAQCSKPDRRRVARAVAAVATGPLGSSLL